MTAENLNDIFDNSRRLVAGNRSKEHMHSLLHLFFSLIHRSIHPDLPVIAGKRGSQAAQGLNR